MDSHSLGSDDDIAQGLCLIGPEPGHGNSQHIGKYPAPQRAVGRAAAKGYDIRSGSPVQDHFQTVAL